MFTYKKKIFEECSIPPLEHLINPMKKPLEKNHKKLIKWLLESLWSRPNCFCHICTQVRVLQGSWSSGGSPPLMYCRTRLMMWCSISPNVFCVLLLPEDIARISYLVTKPSGLSPSAACTMHRSMLKTLRRLSVNEPLKSMKPRIK